MYIDEMTDQQLADEHAATRAAMRLAAQTAGSDYVGLKAWAKEIQAEQYRRSRAKAREALVEGMTGLIEAALAAGVGPANAQADIDAVCSIQLGLAESAPPAWAIGMFVIGSAPGWASSGSSAQWAATVVPAESGDDTSGEMESAGYPAGA